MDVIAEDERFAAMLLSRVGYYHLQEIRTLYTMVGSAQAVVAASDDIRQVLPDASPRLVQLLSHLSDHRRRVADELAYVEAEGVRVLTPCDSGYPRRLWECVDAPKYPLHRPTRSPPAPQDIVPSSGGRNCG